MLTVIFLVASTSPANAPCIISTLPVTQNQCQDRWKLDDTSGLTQWTLKLAAIS